MSQNRSHAVMSQRVEPHDSLDFFPTPPWATRAASSDPDAWPFRQHRTMAEIMLGEVG